MPKLLEIPESDARKLLARPLKCEGCGAWRLERTHGRTLAAGAGLVDERGRGTRLLVELRCGQPSVRRKGREAGRRHYVFSVLWRNFAQTHRVYQLDITAATTLSSCEHQRSHEHLGDRRAMGKPEWGAWSFEEMLLHFCVRSNITFLARPRAPSERPSSGRRS